jgi:hypothetical protein
MASPPGAHAGGAETPGARGKASHRGHTPRGTPSRARFFFLLPIYTLAGWTDQSLTRGLKLPGFGVLVVRVYRGVQGVYKGEGRATEMCRT